MPPYMICAFDSFVQWRAFLQDNPWAFDPAVIDAAAQAIARDGFVDPLFGPVAAADIVVGDANYREGFAHRGLNSRVRAVLLALARRTNGFDPETAIYACEGVTPFAAALRERFPHFVGSEYLPDEAERTQYGVRHEDVTALSFEDESFDVYLSCEVLEHVPDIGRTLSEARRILRPDGCALWTFPFFYGSEDHLVRSVLEDGAVRHLMEPEYHGNPVDSAGGSLVFTVPGWRILEDARQAGFRRAEILFIVSGTHGVLGAEIAGILVFRAVR
jgi:SAM-dependent methyltransferase